MEADPVRGRQVSAEWATHAEELERKSLDTVHGLVHRHVEGELTAQELRVAVNAVYDCITGLVSWDVAQMIYKVRDLCDESSS